MIVAANASAVSSTFYYCKFDNNGTDGFNGWDGNGSDLIITMNNCTASTNGGDGFSLSDNTSLGSTAGMSRMYLTDCEAKTNGSGANDQGATAHKTWQSVLAQDCDFSANFGPGVTNSGGANIVLQGCEIYNNSQHASGNYQILNAASAGFLYIDNCNIHTPRSGDFLIANLAGPAMVVKNSTLTGNSVDGQYLVIFGTGAYLTVFEKLY